MGLAATGSNKKSVIVICITKMSQTTYKDMMAKQVLKKGKEFGGPGWIFPQENVSIHTAKTVNDCSSANKLRILDWPATSLDLSITGNLWEQ